MAFLRFVLRFPLLRPCKNPTIEWMCSFRCITVCSKHTHTHSSTCVCVDLCGSLVCAEKKDFLQMERRLGLCRRLMMNCAFIILLTHPNVVPVICFARFFFPPLKKTVFFSFSFFPVLLLGGRGGDITGGWDRSNKRRKKMAK